jgi:hypothetical protein
MTSTEFVRGAGVDSARRIDDFDIDGGRNNLRIATDTGETQVEAMNARLA